MIIDQNSVCFESKLIGIIENETNLSKVEKIFLIFAVRSDLNEDDVATINEIASKLNNISDIQKSCEDYLDMLQSKIKKDKFKYVEIFTGSLQVTRDDYFKMVRSQISKLKFTKDKKDPRTYGIQVLNRDETFNKKSGLSKRRKIRRVKDRTKKYSAKIGVSNYSNMRFVKGYSLETIDVSEDEILDL